MAFTSGYSLALSRSNDASMITGSSVSSALRACQSKFNVRFAGSQLLGSDPMLLKLGARRQFAAKLSISRRVNLTTCSAVVEESAQSVVPTTVPDESVSPLMDVLPESVRPYLQLARVDKRWTFGPMACFWPFFWGAALAAEYGCLPDWRIFALLAVAAAVFRSAACTLNDLCDMDFDGKAFGLGNQFQVLVAIQLFLHGNYPLAKRWTHWTPAILGLPVSWSVVLGWFAMRGPMGFGPTQFPLALIFFASWCWTLIFETIYCHQDVKGDVDAGIKSLAILLGNDTKLWLTSFGIAFVASLGIVGDLVQLGWPFFASVVATTIHIVWQITSVDINNPIDCAAKFHSNIWVGAFVFGGIVFGKLLA